MSSRFFVKIAFVLLMCTGCGALSKCHPFLGSNCVSQNVSSPNGTTHTVDVGGMVTHPGRIEIPLTGMSLRRALTLAGSVSPQVGFTEGAVTQKETLQKYSELAKNIGYLTATKQDTKTSKEKIAAAEREHAIKEKELNAMEARFLIVEPEKTELSELKTDARSLGTYKYYEEHPDATDDEIEDTNEKIKTYGDNVAVKLESLTSKLTVNSMPAVTDTTLTMVALQRESSLSTHYFPYDLCINGLAGEIRLEPEDLVQVVDVRRTSLNRTEDLDSRNIAITGFVRNPGTFRQQDSRVTVLKHVMDVGKPEYTGPDGAVVIVRDAANGIGEDVFVLPTDLISARPLALSPRRGGDIYYFTPIAQVPVIFDGLVQSVVQTATPTPLSPDKTSTKSGVERISKLDACPATRRFLRECRSLKETLETRPPVPTGP